MTDLRDWIGKTQTCHDEVTPFPAAALSATLDRGDADPETGDTLPPLWHWLYFRPLTRRSDMGPEGHEKLGEFLPPSELPRRMWAGSRLEFHQPLRVGDRARRESRILDVAEKQGRTGRLLFVVVRHEIANPQGVAIVEEQDIVYRDAPEPGADVPAPPRAPSDPEWETRIDPDEVLLFRYSALTFNAHRIHFDRRYAIETEGYPGLVVHGPLIATLMLELVREALPRSRVTRFQFRAVSPLFDTAPFWIGAKREVEEGRVQVWASSPDGGLAASGQVRTDEG